MVERPDCAGMDQLIPELAIGVAAGDERAQALGHLARCVPCRSVLESATSAADALLLIAPEREPSPGFETRVLAGLTGRPRRDETRRRPRHLRSSARPRARPAPYAGALAQPDGPRPDRPWAEWPPEGWPPAGWPHEGEPHRARPPSRVGPRAAIWRRRLLRLATTVTIAGLVGGALWWRTDDDRHLAAGYRATLAIAHGKYMRAAPLLTQSAAPAGYIVAYEGEPSWVVMIVRTGDVSGDYAVRLTTRDGRPVALGTMSVAHGRGTWYATISTSVDQIATVTLTRPRALAITGRLG